MGDTMAQFDYPNPSSVQDTNAEEYVVALYQALGWDQESQLDPQKIKMNPDHWKDVCDQLNQSAEGLAAGYLWMNFGPSADEGVPYGKIEIEEGAFGRGDPGLTEAGRRSIDETVAHSFITEGNVIHLEPDYNETNEFLLQSAYDSRNMTPQSFLEALHDQVDEVWVDSIDLAADEVLERAGILISDERYDMARDYLMENYSFVPPYSHYLNQDMQVNIMLGTEAEKNLDFSSIRDMCDGLNDPSALVGDELDNGLIWLVEQQGHSVDELKDAVANYEKWGFDAVEITHGTFLASVAEEMHGFSNIMGSVTVLASMSMHDVAKMMDEDAAITMPKNTTIGIFAPWAGGGSMLDIQLEKDLVIPSDVRFDLSIEGAGCDQYTVNVVYGLNDKAWKKPLDITDPIRGYDTRAISSSLDDAMKQAKTRSADKNLTHVDAPKNRNSPELGL